MDGVDVDRRSRQAALAHPQWWTTVVDASWMVKGIQTNREYQRLCRNLSESGLELINQPMDPGNCNPEECQLRRWCARALPQRHSPLTHTSVPFTHAH